MRSPTRKAPLLLRLFAAIALGAVVGLVAGPRCVGLARGSGLFVKLLKLLATPLLFAAIVEAVAATRIRVRMGAALLVISLVNALVAAAIALGTVHLIPVGRVVDLDAIRRLSGSFSELPSDSFWLTIFDQVLGALSVNNLLSVIAISFALGIALRFSAATSTGRQLIALDRILLRLCIKILGALVRLVPLAIFGVVASVMGRGGARLFPVLGAFVALIAVGMSLQMFVYYGLIVKLVVRKSVRRFFTQSTAALSTAMSAGSSMATLPVTLQTLEVEMGVSTEAARLAACIGTNFNHDGIILYEAATALFVAQAFGIVLGLSAQMKIVVTSIVAAIGIAGVPEAGLITLSLVLSAAGLPLAAIPLLLPVDWLLGRFRATVNVASDLTVANVLDRMFPGG